jgi:hypothetical protein
MSRVRPKWLPLLGLAILAGCDRGKEHAAPVAASASAPKAVASGALAPAASALPSASAAAPHVTPSPSSSGALVMRPYDAGVNACRTVYGPAQQPFVGELALVPTDTGVLLVTHHDGVPTVTRVVASVDAAPPSVVDAGLRAVTSPPCAVAGAFSFCMDPGGAIHKRPLESEGRDVVVARGRPGTVFAAELIDSIHIVVAYLADRNTTEGVVSAAFASLDDGPPIRLSDEGTGTTYLALAPRGTGLLVFLVDGRVAMTPAHARALTVAQGKLAVGEDAVLFVGGGAEANTRGALGTSANGAAFALLPVGGETGFGMASIRIDDPPHIDEPTTWSLYLNGLDPAPIAATRGTSPIRVARVRPLEKAADGPRGLELGRLDDAGAFISYGLVGSKGRVRSAALTVDKAGMLWLAFTDGAGTWLERRTCPPAP